MPDEVAEESVRIVSEVPPLEPYDLPEEVRAGLLALAQENDILIVGEIHGIAEVPRILAALLPDLYSLGYRGLAFEISSELREPIVAWTADPTQPLPSFFTAPSCDGRGNVETLGLLQQAAPDWDILCFDRASGEPFEGWAWRDAGMAANLIAQRQQFCPGAKVIGVCGNMHSRLYQKAAPEDWTYKFWPSFAANVAEQNPEIRIASLGIRFYDGSFYNETLRKLGPWETVPEMHLEQRPESEHTLDLHLPYCRAASFLTHPAPMPSKDNS